MSDINVLRTCDNVLFCMLRSGCMEKLDTDTGHGHGHGHEFFLHVDYFCAHACSSHMVIIIIV